MINFIKIIDELFRNSFVNELTVEVVSFRLLLAVIFGGIVGYTREKDNKPAGFRTHILVCFRAAVIEFKIIRSYKNRFGKTGSPGCKWE